MSSIKIHNSVTNEWDIVATIEDRGIRVNHSGYKSSNLHGALSEIATALSNHKNNIAWIYKNGTIGGGGGGGGGNTGATGKIVTSITSTPHYMSTTDILIVNYMVESRFTTNFNVTLKVDQQTSITRNIRPNSWETWTVGRLTKGNHTLFISGTDVDLIPLDSLTLSVIAGALELTSTFNDKVIFNVASDIKIPYTASSYLTTPVNLVSKINSASQPDILDIQKDRLLEYPIGKKSVGVYNVELQATSSGFNSNKLEYTINVASTDQLFLSVASNINRKFARGVPIKFAYNIAVLGYTVFVTEYKINGKSGEQSSRLGTNVFEIPSDDFGAGTYTLELTCRDGDNVIRTTEPLLIQIEITASDFEPYQPHPSGLIAWFRARGIDSGERYNWVNQVQGSPITCTLTGINGSSNGFIAQGTNANAIDKSLVINGEAYAEINYKPFSKDKLILTNGFSMSIIYKTENVGNKKARVLDVGEYNPSTDALIAGLYADTEDAEVSTIRKSIIAKIATDEWIHQTFVVDQTFLRVYNNGVITAVVKHDGFSIDDTTNGAGDEKASNINLGSRQVQRNVGGVDTLVRTDFADCEVKDVKIYQRALTSEQVVFNYVGDEYYLHTKTVNNVLQFDEDKQKDLRRINSMDDQGNFAIDTTATSPFALLSINFSDETERQMFREYSARTVWADNDNPFRQFRCTMNFADHSNKRYLNNHQGFITLQGTSSIGYTSKNYEIYLGENPDRTEFLFEPKVGWLPENQFTLKCNMMDSSHANNVGTGRIINNGLNDTFLGGATGWFRAPSPPKTDNVNNENYLKVRDAIDGFPILLEIAMGKKDEQGNDDNYMGVYTFNMGRGSHYNMGLKNLRYKEVAGVVTEQTEIFTGFYAPDVCFCYEISTSHNQGAGAFKQQSDEWIRTDFKKIYPETDSTEAYNQLKTCVVSTSKCGDPVPVLDVVTKEPVQPPQFTESWATQFTEITNWNLPSLADYLILAYTLGMVDNLGKNFMMKTWNKVGLQQESVWYASFYDMDTILGLDNVGIITHNPDVDLDRFPTGNFVVDQEPQNNNLGRGQYNLSDSRLWGLYRQYYKGFESSISEEPTSFRLRQRYFNLRKSGVLSYDNIIKKFMSVINEIGQNYYNRDADIKYLNIFKNQAGDEGYHNLGFLHGTREHYTKLWMKRRITYMDSLFDASSRELIGNTASRDLKFRFNPNPTGTGVTNRIIQVISRSPVFITVLWSGEDNRNDFSKLMVRQDNYTTFQKSFDAGTQSTNMNFGPEVMYMDQIGVGNPSYLDLKDASSLIELDLSGNTFLQAINLEYCVSLRNLYLRDCTKLGLGVDGVDSRKYIDVSACVNLQNLDISNTKLQQVSLPKGGTLKTLRCNDTLIGQLDLSNQSFLETVDLSNCTNLSTVTLKNCAQLKDLILPNTAVVNFEASDCPKLETVNLSRSPYLRSVNFLLTPLMKTIDVSYCNNTALTTLNLLGCPILEELNMTGCANTSMIRFPDTITTMKRLICVESGLTRTQFGTRPEDTEQGSPAVNLAQLTGLTTVQFRACPSLQYVTNINLALTNPTSMFANCGQLKMVKGSMRISGSMASMFTGCFNFMLLGDTTANPVLPADTGNFPLNLVMDGVTNMSSAFFNCTSLSMPDCYYILRRSPNVTTFSSTFQGCNKILSTTARPMSDKIFEKLTRATNTTGMFWNCTGMSGPFPEKALNPMINLVNGSHMFRSCKFTTFNQATLIANTRLTNCAYMFSGNSLSNTVYAQYLFVKNTELTTIENMFASNTGFSVGLQDDKIFAYNPKLENISDLFNGCKVTGRLEPNIFGGVTPTKTETDPITGQLVTYRWPINLVNIGNAFRNTQITGTFSDSLFANLTKLQYAGYCFAGTGIAGEIPANLFANNPELLSTEGFFANLRDLQGAIPATLFANNPKLANIGSCFINCDGLTGTIPATLFGKLPALQVISNVFAGCSKLAGSIPADLFKVTIINNGVPMIVPLSVTDASYLFDGCFGLSGQIPGTLFQYMPNITTLERCFYDCGTIGRSVDTGLTGNIPANLLHGLFSLTNINSLFRRCNKIGFHTVPDENPLNPDKYHMIPAGFFRDSGRLTTMTFAFEYMSSANNGGRAELPLGIFNPLINVTDMSRLFYNSLTGNMTFDRSLFDKCNKLTNITAMFSNESQNGSSNWTGTLDVDLFKKYTSGVQGITGQPLRTVTQAFEKNMAVKGFAPRLWEFGTVSASASCFRLCTQLSNYADIPAGYK